MLVHDLNELELSDDDVRHLTKSLRLRIGEIVTATDGQGSWRRCVWNNSNLLQPLGELQFESQPTQQVTIGFSIPKGSKADLVIEKLTEVGADQIIPIISARTIVRWNEDKKSSNYERFIRVAKAAAMQSRRVWLPKIWPVTDLGDLKTEQLVLAHPGGSAISSQYTTILVGPEGGWSEDELSRSFCTVGLGSTRRWTRTTTPPAGATKR